MTWKKFKKIVDEMLKSAGIEDAEISYIDYEGGFGGVNYPHIRIVSSKQEGRYIQIS